MKRSYILLSIFAVLFSACTSSGKKKTSKSSIIETSASTSIVSSSSEITGGFSSGTSITGTSSSSAQSSISKSSSSSQITTSKTSLTSQAPITNKWCSLIHDAFIYAIGEELPYYQPFDNATNFSPITSTYRAAFMLYGSVSSSPQTAYNSQLVSAGWVFSEIISDPEGFQDHVYVKGTLEARTSYYQGNFYIYALSEENYPTEAPTTKDVLDESDFPSKYQASSGSFSEGTWSSTDISNQNSTIQFKKESGKLILNNIKASKLFFLFANVSKGSPSTMMVKAGTSKSDAKAVQYINGYITVDNSKYIEIYSLGYSAITFYGIASIA